MTRYESAAAEWESELATRRGVEFSPQPAAVARNGRDALRARAPRLERDSAGRVHPVVDWVPGRDVF